MSLLDVAATVLVADPAASLAQVAEAAGIGRTTLHKHFPTREALLEAVGHRVIDQWDAAVTGINPGDSADGGLLAMMAAVIPIGQQLAFLWRTPAFDHSPDIGQRWISAESRGLGVLLAARARGVIAPGLPDWWIQRIFYSVIYVAAESVRTGHLAPRDAPGLALSAFLGGVGAQR